MKKRRGSLNGEIEYVRNGLAAPWTPEEVERMRVQTQARLDAANRDRGVPEVAEIRNDAEEPETPAMAGAR